MIFRSSPFFFFEVDCFELVDEDEFEVSELAVDLSVELEALASVGAGVLLLAAGGFDEPVSGGVV